MKHAHFNQHDPNEFPLLQAPGNIMCFFYVFLSFVSKLEQFYRVIQHLLLSLVTGEVDS